MATPFLNGSDTDTIALIGANNSNNAADTTNVVTNDDGSILERLEGLKDRLSAVDGAANILGADDADNGFASTNVVANADGSMIERQEYLQSTQAVPTADAVTDTLMRDAVGRKTDAAVTTVGTTKTIMAYAKGLVGQIGAFTNTGGTATLSAILGDLANSSLVARLNLLQAQTPATYVPGLGFRVTKTENINTATGVDLFTVTGKVLIKLWTIEVTNAIGAGTTDYKLRIKTDNVDICAATDISSAAIGQLFSISGDATDTLETPGDGIKHVDHSDSGMGNRIVGLAGGTCTLQSLRTAGDASDEVIHIMFYLPLEASASVAAAA